jgi:hypothetical protein
LIRRNSIHVDRDISAKTLSPHQNAAVAPGQSSSVREQAVQGGNLSSVLSPSRVFLDGQTGDQQPSPSREELYMELKKADKLRLDDQRGTKLNCEIPEFLRSSGAASMGTVEVRTS